MAKQWKQNAVNRFYMEQFQRKITLHASIKLFFFSFLFDSSFNTFCSSIFSHFICFMFCKLCVVCVYGWERWWSLFCYLFFFILLLISSVTIFQWKPINIFCSSNFLNISTSITFKLRTRFINFHAICIISAARTIYLSLCLFLSFYQKYIKWKSNIIISHINWMYENKS